MKKKTWIKNRLVENDFKKDVVLGMYDDYLKEFGSDVSLSSYRRYVYAMFEELNGGIDYQDYDTDSVIRLEASKQKLQDVNNAVRKSNREGYRVYNNLEEIYTEYVDLLSKVDLSKFSIKEHTPSPTKKIGVLQFSDWHANELIMPDEANNNAYDFIILSKRLKKYITEATSIFKFKKITEIHIFMTGDFINSSRRLGEKLAQASSLTRASLLTTYIIQQAIIELSKNFNITISSVVGNESRIAENWDSTDISLSENFDYLIFNSLKIIFSKTPVKFNESKNIFQCIVPMSNGFNALIMHGNQFRTPNAEKEIGKFLQSYVYNGTKIHGVFYGHYHSSSIGDFISRSSSLCGGNAYSTNDLGYLSRASQNIYIINEDLGIDAMKIDLQNANNDGYNILDELERYNVKSVSANTRVVIENLT